MATSGVFCLHGMCREIPPLPCRASPPQGGRSTRGEVTAISTLRMKQRQSFLLISPLEREMSGRTEGGCPLSAASTPNYFAAVSAPSGALLLSTCTTTDMPGESSAASG